MFKKWLLKETQVPTEKELLPYCDDQECYEVVELIKQKYPILETDSGFFLRKKGAPADHAWLKAPNGTIIDPTYSQFNSKYKIVFAKPGSSLFKRYYSWNLHHNPYCLHKLLKIPYRCALTEIGKCDWKGY